MRRSPYIRTFYRSVSHKLGSNIDVAKQEGTITDLITLTEDRTSRRPVDIIPRKERKIIKEGMWT